MRVHVDLGVDRRQDPPVGVDHERRSLHRTELETLVDAEDCGHLAIGVRQQRVVEFVLVGELLLLVDRVLADPDAGGTDRLELGGFRSRKWQLSLVQPYVMAAG